MIAMLLCGLLLHAPSCGDEGAEEAPAAEAEVPYLARRAEKLDPERGLWRQAEDHRRKGLDLLESGLAADALRSLRDAEALMLRTLDGAGWSQELQRFPMDLGRVALLLHRKDEAAHAFARAVALQGPRAEGAATPAFEALDAVLAELEWSGRRAELVAAAREELVEAVRRELAAYGVGRPAPDFELELEGGGTWRSAERAGRALVLYFCAPGRAEARADAAALPELARRLGEGGGVELLQLAPPRELELWREQLGEQGRGLPLAASTPEFTERFLVLDLPALAVIDAEGNFRYASSGYSPFTLEAAARAALALAAPAPDDEGQ